MLYLVLMLVVVAFGLLIAALTTANTVWAWVSVAISVVAAALLIFDWARGRRRVAATSAPREVRQAGEVEETGAVTEAPPESVEVTSEMAPVVEPVVEQPVAEEAAPEPSDDAEPGEEPTDATDLLIVSDLSVEVRVVDEHPRYHLAKCSWLSNKATIPLPVSEARSLGFTPCARCGPDATLAAQHRASKGAKQ